MKSLRPAGSGSKVTRSRPRSISPTRSMSGLAESWRAIMRDVIVTGGSRGLGLAIVKHLATHGYRVTVIARRESEQLHGEIVRSEAEHASAIAFVPLDRKSTRLNSSHLGISYAVFCLKKKKNKFIQ